VVVRQLSAAARDGAAQAADWAGQAAQYFRLPLQTLRHDSVLQPKGARLGPDCESSVKDPNGVNPLFALVAEVRYVGALRDVYQIQRDADHFDEGLWRPGQWEVAEFRVPVGAIPLQSPCSSPR
jgi:hypothetical protein